jgi:hypothetical protein
MVVPYRTVTETSMGPLLACYRGTMLYSHHLYALLGRQAGAGMAVDSVVQYHEVPALHWLVSSGQCVGRA